MRARLVRLGLAVSVSALVILPAAPVRAATTAERYISVRHGIQASLTDLTHALAENKTTITTRDLTQAALATMEFNGNVQQAELFVDTALSGQDMVATSPTYGEIPWDAFDTRVHDLNADEFAMQAIGPLLFQFGSRFPADYLLRLRPHLAAAIAALNRRKIPVSYTNIYLMKAVDLELLGQAATDPVAQASGLKSLQAWVAYTNENGIREFASPALYATDLDSLETASLFSHGSGSEFGTVVRAILDFFWRDLVASTFDGTLAGAHGRDDDFVAGGTGGVDVYLYVEGRRLQPPARTLLLDRIYTWMSSLPGAYHPSTAVLAPVSMPVRETYSRWDANYTRNRYTYVTRDFAMGSASGNFGRQDKLVSVRLKGIQQGISVLPDTSDDPYGDHTIVSSSGHAEPVHLPLGARVVQSGGLMLVTLDLGLGRAGSLSRLATNVLLPQTVKRLQALSPDVTLPTGSRFDRALGTTSVIGVRGGTAAVVVRPFAIGTCAGHAFSIHLKEDASGQKVHAMRLAIYHNCGKAHPRSLQLAFLLLAAHDTNQTRFVALLRLVQSSRLFSTHSRTAWTVTARVVGYPPLTVYRDSQSPNSDYELINGVERIYAPLVVNGRSLHIAG